MTLNKSLSLCVRMYERIRVSMKEEVVVKKTNTKHLLCARWLAFMAIHYLRLPSETGTIISIFFEKRSAKLEEQPRVLYGRHRSKHFAYFNQLNSQSDSLGWILLLPLFYK